MIHIVLDLKVPGNDGVLWEDLQSNVVVLLKRHVASMEAGADPLCTIGTVDYDIDGQVMWTVEGEV